jgi:predicted permease
MFYPTIPLDEGDRLVGLENWDLERNNEERRSLFDFGVWRAEMASVEDMTAFRTVPRNLISADGPVELVEVAEITPSGFRLARVPPLLGRPLVEGDERDGAPPVVVIGYDVWRTRFASDAGVVGRELRLGNTVHTVVGVMPRGFAFPMSHDLWTPLVADPTSFGPGEGPAVFISGRLAPGLDLEDAQAEMTVIGRRMAAAHPETHGRFRAQIMPYVYPLVDVNQQGGESFFWQFAAMQSLMSLLLLVVCVNVAVLIYARVATRRSEIAVRTALGASRRRVVAQLFAESLVLAAGGAALGLVLAKVGMGVGEQIMLTEMGSRLPFWMDLGISGPALAYAALLTVLTAVITGVVPGLQATSRRALADTGRSGGGSGMRLGRTWTSLVVVQVALAITALPIALVMGWWEVRGSTTVPTFDTDRFLIAAVFADTDPPLGEDVETWRAALPARYTELRRDLTRILEAEPGVSAFTLGSDPPIGGARVRILMDGPEPDALAGDGREVRTSRVGPGFMGMFEVPVVAGRTLRDGDWDEGAPDVVVVDRAFVRQVLDGGDALGRRIRFVSDDAEDAALPPVERWYEIVGVVADLEANPIDADLVEPRVYGPRPDVSAEPPRVLVRVAGSDAAAFAPRFREIVASLDPTLRVGGGRALSDLYRQERLALGLMALALGLVLLSVLLLSAAGIYALMSFTVTQRRREIGLRTALGARPARLLGGVFGRALRQIGLGVIVGVSATVGLDFLAGGELLRGHGPVLLPAMVLIMTTVGVLAAAGPARRGLRVAPAEALKAE